MTGRLYAGTSGFAYRAWSPRFYPAGAKSDDLLPWYAARLTACELNSTWYRQPSPEAVAGWLAATPPDFRFAVKAQRGGSMRSLLGDPDESVPWLTAPIARFGDRLGTVLFRVPEPVRVDLARLRAMLARWPAALPITLELQDPSWHVDEVFDELRSRGAALSATELPDDEAPPTIRHTGRFLYLRLRRHDYEPAGIRAWAERLAPFLEAGSDAFVFFRHDESGRAPELATELVAAVDRVRA